MKWKFTDDRPVYLQIISLIQAAVLSGEFPPGSRIPSVRELAAEARVNPNTMQRALAELEREGLLDGGGTAGRTVTDNEAVLEATRARVLQELVKSCAEQFAAFGVSAGQAADLLSQYEEKEEE